MQIEITGESIKIGQLLKKMGFITTGGMSKHFLETNNVVYKDEKVTQRGLQIPLGATVWVNDEVYQIVAQK